MGHISWYFEHRHCVKSVRLQSFYGPYFFSVNLRIQFECRKIWTRKNSEFAHFLRSALNTSENRILSCPDTSAYGSKQG